MMRDNINFDEIISKYRSDPYEYLDVLSPHTGRVKFNVSEGEDVQGPSGKWHHKPGTLLYVLNRENNPKPIHSQTNGVVSSLREEREGHFVEAGEKLMTIKHPMKKREIIEKILQNVLYLFKAPEKAKYFFSLEIQSRIEKQGEKAVVVQPGDEIITMSLMKRDNPIFYDGEPGIIHSVYFTPGISVNQGEPLIGVCPQEKLPLIQKIITNVKAEWD
jgi:acetyl/propionyl-CoA carboxylase alpha subunit